MRTLNWKNIFAGMLAILGTIAGGAYAQPQEGKEYTVLNLAGAGEKDGKIEVIEFFSYSCPHCYNLEPALEAWVKKLPEGVVFKRVPAVGNVSWTQLARLYYSLEAKGLLETLHKKAFKAIHEEKQNLASEKVRGEWLVKQGVDLAQYMAVEKSFAIQSRLSQAGQMMSTYKVDGVPMLIVGGKYVTSMGQAGGPEKVIVVVNHLIELAKKQ